VPFIRNHKRGVDGGSEIFEGELRRDLMNEGALIWKQPCITTIIMHNELHLGQLVGYKRSTSVIGRISAMMMIMNFVV
jgi:hypothetical protein